MVTANLHYSFRYIIFRKSSNGHRWSLHTIKHCIIFQAMSPATYANIRKSNIMLLPCPDTLKAYTGRSTGKVGVTPLVEQRLAIERNPLSEKKRESSLLIDEMSIKESRIYLRNLDKYVGQVDMDGVVPVKNDNRLANKMLAFVLSGMNTKYSIPVAVFLVEKLTAEQQHRLTMHVIRKVH